MARPPSRKPTDAEMEILRIIWKRGNSTVRDVHDAFLAASRASSYTAIATTMRTMVDKKIIRLVDARRPQKFAAVSSQQSTYTSIVEDITRRVFGGSLSNLMRSALSGRRHSADEIAELKKLLAQFDEKAPPRDANRAASPDAAGDSSTGSETR